MCLTILTGQCSCRVNCRVSSPMAAIWPRNSGPSCLASTSQVMQGELYLAHFLCLCLPIIKNLTHKYQMVVTMVNMYSNYGEHAHQQNVCRTKCISKLTRLHACTLYDISTDSLLVPLLWGRAFKVAELHTKRGLTYRTSHLLRAITPVCMWLGWLFVVVLQT